MHWLWRPGVRSAVSRKVFGSDLCGCACFFKQKTAYEIMSGDWSS
eukprot:COSAG02_NODE_45222_length_359_cov_0.765385_1_plen_44_part_10